MLSCGMYEFVENLVKRGILYLNDEMELLLKLTVIKIRWGWPGG